MWKIIPILQERKGQVNKYLYQEIPTYNVVIILL